MQSNIDRHWITPACAEALEPRRLLASVGVQDTTLLIVGNRHTANTIIISNDALNGSLIHVYMNGHRATFDNSKIEINHILAFGGEAADDILDQAGVGARKFPFATTLEGGGGNDTLIGGASADMLVAGRHGNCFLGGGGGDDTLIGGDGNETLSGDAGANLIIGGSGNDQLLGGSGNDLIFGGNGNDTIVGGDGINELVGGSGVNQIFGGNDTDSIWGGGNRDTIIHRGTGDETVDGGALTGADKILKELFPKIPSYPRS